jgi:hypothetical protein
MPSLNKTYYKTVSCYKVFWVSGVYIRRYLAADFACGGNGFAYHFIPFGEIWLEYADSPCYTKYRTNPEACLIHELKEATGMRYRHLSYWPAHRLANHLEGEFKRGDISENEAISRAGWHRGVQRRRKPTVSDMFGFKF